MPAEIVLPVYLRVGVRPAAHVGDLRLALTAVPTDSGLRLDMAEFRSQLAAFLRAAADAVENPSDDGEVPDAAARG